MTMIPYDGPPVYDGKGFHLFGKDDETLTRVWCKHENGALTFRVDQDVTQIVDTNKAIINDTQAKGFGDYVRVASVPLSLMEQTGLNEARKNDDQKFISRWLNDGDNRAFRTHEGRF